MQVFEIVKPNDDSFNAYQAYNWDSIKLVKTKDNKFILEIKVNDTDQFQDGEGCLSSHYYEIGNNVKRILDKVSQIENLIPGKSSYEDYNYIDIKLMKGNDKKFYLKIKYNDDDSRENITEIASFLDLKKTPTKELVKIKNNKNIIKHKNKGIITGKLAKKKNFSKFFLDKQKIQKKDVVLFDFSSSTSYTFRVMSFIEKEDKIYSMQISHDATTACFVVGNWSTDQLKAIIIDLE